MPSPRDNEFGLPLLFPLVTNSSLGIAPRACKIVHELLLARAKLCMNSSSSSHNHPAPCPSYFTLHHTSACGAGIEWGLSQNDRGAVVQLYRKEEDDDVKRWFVRVNARNGA